MRVAIAGGHGRIALLLSQDLSATGEEVLGLIRNPDHAGDVEAAGAEPRIVDLESAEPQAIATELGDVDAVVFAAGAGPGSGAARKETVDYQAAVKMIDVAKATGAGRYVMISAMAADASHPGDDVFDVYLRAKGRADDAVRASGLDWAIVRPGMLTDDPATGSVDLGESVERGAIPRADVAAVVARCLRTGAADGTTFEVVSGQTPIADAL